MLLFKSFFKPLLIAGAKTQTRRAWKRPLAAAGQLHACYTRPPFAGGRPFAFVRIRRVWRQRPRDVTAREVRAEGFAGHEQFLRVLRDAAGTRAAGLPARMFAVEFTVLWCALPGRDVNAGALRDAINGGPGNAQPGRRRKVR
jgi:hypothetical protein